MLGDIDGEFVRLIDLDCNRFYYRRSIDWFNSAWDGTALIIAKEPVAMEGSFAKLDDSNCEKLHKPSLCPVSRARHDSLLDIRSFSCSTC